MSQVQLAADQQDLIIGAAAQQYNIPKAILKGVYAIETGSGKTVNTSTAGAVGAFQFLPSTAKQYNYPVTNNVDGTTFSQQAYAAAHYISDLYKQHGGNIGGAFSTNAMDAALRAYSGGGYGLSQVQAKSGNQPVNNAYSGVPGAISQAASTVSDIPGAISGAFNTAVNDAKYAAVLVAALVLAVMLISHGVKGSGGGGRKVVPVPV